MADAPDLGTDALSFPRSRRATGCRKYRYFRRSKLRWIVQQKQGVGTERYMADRNPLSCRIKAVASHCPYRRQQAVPGSGVTSTVSSLARSSRSITRRMASSGMPFPSGSVTASFVGMSSPSSRASRASSLMSASAALIKETAPSAHSAGPAKAAKH